MKPLLALLGLLATGWMLGSSLGCASDGAKSGGAGGYYGRSGSIHRDSFPAPGGPGSPYRYGRPRYRR